MQTIVVKDTNEKYGLDIIKMIRNNNIPIGEECLEEYTTYFMLDYFDLLFHKTLTGKNKTYMEFWNIRNNHGKNIEKNFNYKAAYRTLSLYAKKGNENTDIFEIHPNVDAKCNIQTLSNTPFLGIIQINLIYTVFDKEPDVDKTLLACEKKIMDHIQNNGTLAFLEASCKMYRSSTSGDLCLIVKSASIENIYRISALINHLIICHEGEKFKFNTYTNVGIECTRNENSEFLSFCNDTITQNEKCEIALRITSEHRFAKRLIQKIEETNKANKKNAVIKPMQGLFGRYDFLLHATIKEFAQIYPDLCRSKIIGNQESGRSNTGDEEKSWIQLLKEGINENKIQIINERVLVNVSDDFCDSKDSEGVSRNDYQQFYDMEKKLKKTVENFEKTLTEEMKSFHELEPLFIEERRVFIDISRELFEVISTYVPQGMENDSHVNWQLLISDLDIVFSCTEEWKESYKQCEDDSKRKKMRIQFLNDVRLITDAINQYYKLLQNVNAQTWQSPVYEIQTQLDAEKMMIAYREFLYEYFYAYKKQYENERTMIFPIVYPDMTIDIACVAVAFKNIRNIKSQLLICKVPSFEYYGRMFDMLPWILHEASHSIRTQEREDRNTYVIYMVMHSVFNQMLYKFFNKYSNDFGYHKLGELENDILDIIVDAAVNVFSESCEEKNEKICDIGIDFLITELLEFLLTIFDENIYQMEENEDTVNIKAVQTRLFHFLGKLQLLEAKVPVNGSTAESVIAIVERSAENADEFSGILKLIYDTYYKQVIGKEPSKEQWKIIRYDIAEFEVALKEAVSILNIDGDKELKRDYCFTMRELNRLYGTWHKRRRYESNEKLFAHLWKRCLSAISLKIQDGFEQNKGFTELYRILNMIFNSGDLSDSANEQKIAQDFNILVQEEIYLLVDREVTIYRESYADLYMAAALGLNVFGYCRQVSQTTSDTSIENHLRWSEGINIHRFRAVTAVLLANKGEKIEYIGNKIRIPMDTLLEDGKKYCHDSLDCAKTSILNDLKQENTNDSIEGRNGDSNIDERRKVIVALFEGLNENVDYIFSLFKKEESVKDALEDSLLSKCLNPDDIPDMYNEKTRNLYVEKMDEIKRVQNDFKAYRHIIYRLKCFITLLYWIGDDGHVILSKYEYEHLEQLYKAHSEKCSKLKNDTACIVVSDYFNSPNSAVNKTPEIMLEETIDFIQTYYYRNRFKVMSSEEIRREVKTK